jgi:hypothetical protein
MFHIHTRSLGVQAASRTRGCGRPVPTGDRGIVRVLLSKTGVRRGLIGRKRLRQQALRAFHNRLPPEVVLRAVDLDFRLIDGDLLTNPAVRLEDVFQPVKPLSDRLIRSTNWPIHRHEWLAWYKNAARACHSVGMSSQENTSC